MSTSQRRSALVESVAQALSFAINDPMGHTSWASTQQNDSLCKRRRGAAEAQRAATVFDSSAIPPIGIDKYLMRLSTTFRCSDASFIAALILVDRLLSYDGGRLPLTMRNVHRVFLASLVVAVKYHEDLVYANSHYAKGGGVVLREVNRLERVLLAALDFDLRVDVEQYQMYESALLALRDCGSQGYHTEAIEGAPCKPLATEGAVAPAARAVVTEIEAAAPAPPLAPTVKRPAAPPTTIPSAEDASTEAPPLAPTVQRPVAQPTTTPSAEEASSEAPPSAPTVKRPLAPPTITLSVEGAPSEVTKKCANVNMTGGGSRRMPQSSLEAKTIWQGADKAFRAPWVTAPEGAILDVDLALIKVAAPAGLQEGTCPLREWVFVTGGTTAQGRMIQ